MTRLPLSLLALSLMASVLACDPDSSVNTTAAPVEVNPPAEVAATVLDAILNGQTEIAADSTLLEQMPWMAMAEGASIQQAVDLLDEGRREVAINYWQGFAEGTDLPDLRIGPVAESEVGGHRFATVRVGSGQRLRLVLRMEDRWLVDVVASFGATLAERLRDAVDIIAANRGPDADRLAELIRRQRDSVTIAMDSSTLNDSSRQALTELGVAMDLLRGGG